MRAAALALLASITIFSVGCHHPIKRHGCSAGCDSCGQVGHGHGGHLAQRLGQGHLAGHRHLGDHGHHAHRGRHQHGHLWGQVQHDLGHGHGGPARVGRVPHGYMYNQMYSQGGPPSPTVAYPYYTTRAPRDFLLENPPSIGP